MLIVFKVLARIAYIVKRLSFFESSSSHNSDLIIGMYSMNVYTVYIVQGTAYAIIYFDDVIVFFQNFKIRDIKNKYLNI